MKKVNKGPTTVDVENFLTYRSDPWPYYYAYPEYFQPEKVPGVGESKTFLSTQKFSRILTTDESGGVHIYFCPGISALSAVNIPAQMPAYFNYALNKEDHSNMPIDGGANAVTRVSGSANFDSYRCTGGYMQLTFPTTGPGALRYTLRERTAIRTEAVLLEDMFEDEEILPPGNLIFRYRFQSVSQLQLIGKSPTLPYYLIHCFGFFPRTTIQVNIEQSFEGRVPNPEMARFVGANRTNNSFVDFESHCEKARELILRMPDPLRYSPLTNPKQWSGIFISHPHNGYIFETKKVKPPFVVPNNPLAIAPLVINNVQGGNQVDAPGAE